MIQAIGTRALVELEPIEQETPGGIVIPDDVAWRAVNRPDQRWGRVVNTGSRVTLVEPGQRVMVDGWLNESLEQPGYGGYSPRDALVMVDEAQIMAVDEEAACLNSTPGI